MEIKDIEKLAELAKIELNDEEKKSLLKDLDGILDYVKKINEVEVPEIGIEYKSRNVWREDEIAESSARKVLAEEGDLINGQFPDEKDGFVKVKKIL